jgi:hypothetical protein
MSSRAFATVKVAVRSSEVVWATPTSTARAVLGVMLARMQLSFLSNCDDIALLALKLNPDTKIAYVVPADV